MLYLYVERNNIFDGKQGVNRNISQDALAEALFFDCDMVRA
jgi:hypothetical protein